MSMFESGEIAEIRQSRQSAYQDAELDIDIAEDVQDLIDEFDGHMERSESEALALDLRQTVGFYITQNPQYQEAIRKLVEARHTAVLAVMSLREAKEDVLAVMSELEDEVATPLEEARRIRDNERLSELDETPAKSERKRFLLFRAAKN